MFDTRGKHTERLQHTVVNSLYNYGECISMLERLGDSLSLMTQMYVCIHSVGGKLKVEKKTPLLLVGLEPPAQRLEVS